MLSIGQFARLANISVRALRFYDQTRLLCAAHVDAGSGYRRYDVAQLLRLRQIRAFQELGFSLKDIRELQRRDLPSTRLRALMEERQAEIKRGMRDDFARLKRIEQRLRDLNGLSAAYPSITLQETAETWVVSLRQKLQRYEQAEDMFQELERQVPHHLLTPQRSAFWHACESSSGRIDCEVVRCLRAPVSHLRGLRVYRLPAATVASALHCGSDETLPESYQQLNAWIAASDFRLQGAKREIYWLEPQSRNAMQSVTEIQFPVARAAARRRPAA